MKKKEALVRTAARLFAERGYEGTTTAGIAREAGVTEPLIYYHFTGKEDLFNYILGRAAETYFERLETLKADTRTQFEKIAKLIRLHFHIVEEMPHETYLIASACPARLSDPDSVCTKTVTSQRAWLKDFLSRCLKAGIRSGEFKKVPLEATVIVLIALLNAVLRQRVLGLEDVAGLPAATVDFCRRSLLKNSA